MISVCVSAAVAHAPGFHERSCRSRFLSVAWSGVSNVRLPASCTWIMSRPRPPSAALTSQLCSRAHGHSHSGISLRCAPGYMACTPKWPTTTVTSLGRSKMLEVGKTVCSLRTAGSPDSRERSFFMKRILARFTCIMVPVAHWICLSAMRSEARALALSSVVPARKAGLSRGFIASAFFSCLEITSFSRTTADFERSRNMSLRSSSSVAPGYCSRCCASSLPSARRRSHACTPRTMGALKIISSTYPT